MKKKLDVDMPATVSLGPAIRHGASGHGDGTKGRAMLPCNVIFREVPGGVEVSAIDPWPP